MKKNGIVVGLIGLAMTCGVIAGCGSSSSITSPSGGGDANIAGTYTLTLTASRACTTTLPAALLTRKYTAIITQTGNQIAVNLTGAQFILQANAGLVSGNNVTLEIAFDESTDLTVAGTAIGVVSGGTITGTLNGSWGDLDHSCSAADHAFQFVQQ